MTTVDALAHENFVRFCRWRAANEPDTESFEGAGMFALAGPLDWPSSRVAIRTDPNADGAQAADAVHDYFAARGATAIVYARVDADDDLAEPLAGLGYRELNRTPEMVCDRRLPDRTPAPGVTVRLARDEQDVLAYAAVAGAAFAELAIPDHDTRRHLSNTDALLADDTAVAIAEVDGAVTAGAMVTLSGEGPDAYVGWVATLASGRRRGLGDAVTRLVTNTAFDRGARLVTLEASQYGEPIYRAMGYRELYRYRMLIKA